LTDDIVLLANALGTIPNLCINLTIIVACLAYLGWLSWLILAVVIAFIILAITGYWLVSKLAMKSFRQLREDEEVLFKHFSALTKGVKEMKLHRERREAFLTEMLLPTATSYRNHNVTGSILFTVAGTWGRLLLFVMIAVLIFVFPNLTNTTTQAVAAASLVIIYLVGPLEGVILTIPMLGRAEISLKKLQELGLSLSALSTEGRVTKRLSAGSVVKSVELEGVVHSYNRERRDTKFTLGPIDLTLTPGELVFLVGDNGSGKTTLVKLLCGLYIPESGTISLNDELITEENIDHYRQLFSALFGDFYLFESFLGMTRSDLDARARDYLVRFHLDSKVTVHDGKLSTIAVSQGQRKRLALLSAYLEDRPFYIFDEWASDQDPLFKEVFYTELLPELIGKGKAVLVVTHDEKFFPLADRIVKLNNGRTSYDSAVQIKPQLRLSKAQS